MIFNRGYNFFQDLKFMRRENYISSNNNNNNNKFVKTKVLKILDLEKLVCGLKLISSSFKILKILKKKEGKIKITRKKKSSLQILYRRKF